MRKNIIDIEDGENRNRRNQRGEGGLKRESAGRDYRNRGAFSGRCRKLLLESQGRLGERLYESEGLRMPEGHGRKN